MKAKIDLNFNAVKLRKKLGEDSSSPIDVFSLIGGLDHITLVFYPMSDKISGMCVRVDEKDSLIAINSTLSYGRQRFTAAHELYHIFFQSNFRNVVCGKDIEVKKEDEERNADAFASFFLVPYEALNIYISEVIKEDETLSIADVVKIEQHFGMSRQATLFRLQSEGFITNESANTWKTNVIKSAIKLGYDDKLYKATSQEKQTTGNYIALVERLKEKDLISQGKYAELLLDAYRPDIVYNLSVEGEDKYD